MGPSVSRRLHAQVHFCDRVAFSHAITSQWCFVMRAALMVGQNQAVRPDALLRTVALSREHRASRPFACRA
jgi:hypothetical protein